jgi:hypothetical protein
MPFFYNLRSRRAVARGEAPFPDLAVLRNALSHILKYPENHSQSLWCGVRDSNGNFTCGGDVIPVAADNSDHPPCGTTLCQAGWIAFLYAPSGVVLNPGNSMMTRPSGKELFWKYVDAFAAGKANLSYGQARALFHDAGNVDDLKAMIRYMSWHPRATQEQLRQAAMVVDRSR